MSKTIEVKYKGVSVNVYTAHTGKYVYYQIADYSSGKRKLLSFSNLDKAKDKAQEIAGATGSRERDMIPLNAIKQDLQLAIELVGETSLVAACHTFAECAKLIDPHSDLGRAAGRKFYPESET